MGDFLQLLVSGTAVGAIYALAPARLRALPLSGPLFGVAVWGGSYLGLLPATRLMRRRCSRLYSSCVGMSPVYHSIFARLRPSAWIG